MAPQSGELPSLGSVGLGMSNHVTEVGTLAFPVADQCSKQL
jgi:hypothetical protein